MADSAIEWDSALAEKALAAAPEAFRRHMVSYLLQAGNMTRAELVKASPGKDGGEGTLAASWGVFLKQTPTLRMDVRSSAKYAYWVDQGRGAGKMPPYDAIEKWVHRLGLGGRATGEEREAAHKAHAARKGRRKRSSRRDRTVRLPGGGAMEGASRESIIYLVRRKIGLYGTYYPNDPPHFVEGTRKKLEPKLEDLYKDYVLGFVRELNA